MSKKKLIIIVVAAVAVVAAAVVLMWQTGALHAMRTPKICLDAGHGGSDVGAEANGRYEKDDNLRLTLAVGKILEDNGIEVIYTRSDDEFVSLEDRADFANDNNATFFVSIHRNSAQAQASGVEIWIENTAPSYEQKLAERILEKIDAVGYGNNRGVRRGYQGNPTANYFVNAATDMPSCLIEMGFITTEEDNELFDSKLDEYAQAIAHGIMKKAEE